MFFSFSFNSFRVFLEAILTILRDDEREHLTAAELFSELKARHPTTTVFALSPKTILPFYIYSTDGKCYVLISLTFYSTCNWIVLQQQTIMFVC